MPRPGIAARTAGLLLLVALGASGLAGIFLVRAEERAERRLLEDRAATLASAVEKSLGEAMLEHRPASMLAVLGAMVRTEGVAGVALADTAGRVRFAAGEYPGSVATGAPFAWTASRLSVSRPIANGPACRGCHHGPTAGALFVSLDASGVGPRVSAAARRTALLLAGAMLATAAVVALVLRREVGRPLAALRAFAERLGRGDLAARPPRAPAELGDLAAALSGMADQVERSHADLETRVEDRTAQLAKALAEANSAREARAADLRRLQAVIDSMVEGVLFIDAEDRIALVNQAGRALRSIGGDTGRALRDCHPSVAHGLLDRVLGYLRNGDDAGPPHSILKEREQRFETTYAPVRLPDGTYLGTVMVIRDIAERRSLERRLLDAERLAGLGQMSAQIAHELRNPLNAIGGAAQYLRRRLGEDAEVAEYSALIGDEVQRVNRFVSALLGVARPAEPVLASTNVNRLLREAARRAAVARGLPGDAVRLDLAADLPPLDLDAPMITEALVNLLTNAFEAGGEAGPEVASRYETRGGEATVVIEVRDRGCGIPADQIDEVLRPFVTTKPGGHGLGLVVVTRAVEQHRARFELGPREGGGTVARVRFPVRRTTDRQALAIAGGNAGERA
ncbi:MAG TPA: ATP-binding protein [Anaeromyxobacteraceae bacterium]|nr:ATP-binding protein [Anaeromyxobacteraceae bacterium]